MSDGDLADLAESLQQLLEMAFRQAKGLSRSKEFLEAEMTARSLLTLWSGLELVELSRTRRHSSLVPWSPSWRNGPRRMRWRSCSALTHWTLQARPLSDSVPSADSPKPEWRRRHGGASRVGRAWSTPG